MTTLWRFAGLGALSGAITGGIVPLAVDDKTLLALYCVPGLAFGIIIGAALVLAGLLNRVRLPLFLVAAALANAAAVFCAIEVFENVSHILDSELITFGIIGLGAGAFGATLLCLAGKGLMPLASLVRPIATGTICGVFLPVLIEGEWPGTFAFYIVWHAAFAAALASSIEPARHR